MEKISIAGRPIGSHCPPYIIAELSANHGGHLEQALKIIKAAKEAGADAVKLQTYTADTLTINSEREDFKIHGGLWDGHTLYSLYQKAQTPFEWHKPMFDYARELGITLFSSPFDESAVQLLESLEAPAYKIASFEIVDLPLIACVAQTGKPLILSTGLANETEIGEAVDTAYENGTRELALLHCISGYPTPIEEANLAVIPDMKKRFKTVVGFSDHTVGITAALASIALGASLIEKHFILDHADETFDKAFSIEPGELRRLCDGARETWQALGRADYAPKDSEKANRQLRRSIYVVRDMQKGELFSKETIKCIRPSNGLAPKFYSEVLGLPAARHIKRGEPLKQDMIEQ